MNFVIRHVLVPGGMCVPELWTVFQDPGTGYPHAHDVKERWHMWYTPRLIWCRHIDALL